jgi:hypothetical protein
VKLATHSGGTRAKGRRIDFPPIGSKRQIEIIYLTNHPSFDIPIDNIDQNLAFSPFPVAQPPYGDSTTPPLATNCNSSTPSNGFYVCPTGLGQVVKTIGSALQIQMSLSLLF